MTDQTTSRPLPQYLVALTQLLEGELVTSGVLAFIDKVGDLLVAKRPMHLLHISYGQIKRHHPDVFDELYAVINRPSVIDRARDSGAMFALHKVNDICAKIRAGCSIPQAFAGRPGRPRSMSFSLNEDLGFVVYARAQSVRSETALRSIFDHSSAAPNNPQINRSALQRAVPKINGHIGTDLPDLTAAILQKRSLSL